MLKVKAHLNAFTGGQRTARSKRRNLPIGRRCSIGRIPIGYADVCTRLISEDRRALRQMHRYRRSRNNALMIGRDRLPLQSIILLVGIVQQSASDGILQIEGVN